MSYFAPSFLPRILIFSHLSFTAPMASQKASSLAPSTEDNRGDLSCQEQQQKALLCQLPALDAPFPHPTVASASRHLCPQQQVLLPPSHSSPGKQEDHPNGLKGRREIQPYAPCLHLQPFKGDSCND